MPSHDAAPARGPVFCLVCRACVVEANVAVGAGPCTCAAGQSYSHLSVSEPHSRATAGIWHTGRQSTRAVPRGIDVGVVGGSGPSGPVSRPGPRWENPSTGPDPNAFGPSSERAIDWGYRPPAQASAPDSWPDLTEAGAAPSRPSRAARGPECGRSTCPRPRVAGERGLPGLLLAKYRPTRPWI